MTFNAKNLSYDSPEPAFLRKLRGQYGRNQSDRHEMPLARPRKQARLDQDDDHPTYVMEEGKDTISKDEYDIMMRDADKQAASVQTTTESPSTDKTVHEAPLPNEERLGKEAGIGIGTKKKQGRVIGSEQDPEESGEAAPTSERKPRKSKKIKLSFDVT